jgi:hypothetical protein
MLGEDSMATSSLNQPEFQLLINPKTGKKRGRIYLPKFYIVLNLQTLKLSGCAFLMHNRWE